jgi:membrane-bound lytic murein transglycosylase B
MVFLMHILSYRAAMVCAVFFAMCIFFFAPIYAHSQSLSKEELEIQLQEIQFKIDQQQEQLESSRTTARTLQEKLDELQLEQDQLRSEIYATNLRIQTLQEDITQAWNGLFVAEQKIDKHKQQMTALIQLLSKHQPSMIELLLSAGSLSEVLQIVESGEQITNQLQKKLRQMVDLKQELEDKKHDLERQKTDSEQLRAVQVLQQDQLREKELEHSQLLEQTQGEEERYRLLIEQDTQQAKHITYQIYELMHVDQQITFEYAVALARRASDETGVRAAFILAILTQESNLGRNVGTCNRAGDPESKSWRSVMKPSRDHAPFLVITNELGRDPDITPVSCPMRDSNGNQIGWGGAMGPAQFIPSTWMGYRDRVSAITNRPADPWNIVDAMLAASLKLKANGGVGSRDAEWRAAMIYFSGSTNMAFRFYADRVLRLADRYQQELDSI